MATVTLLEHGEVLLDATPCRLVNSYRRFRRTWYIYFTCLAVKEEMDGLDFLLRLRDFVWKEE
jgi:hypothetical protein